MAQPSYNYINRHSNHTANKHVLQYISVYLYVLCVIPLTFPRLNKAGLAHGEEETQSRGVEKIWRTAKYPKINIVKLS